MSTLGERAVRHAQALIRIDTTNPGPGEERAAAYVVDVLAAAGATAEVVEPAPGRCSVLCRVPGRDPELPALLVHGHLDVVPAVEEGWTHDPFGGEEVDGFLWGRGAVDMKNAVGMMLALQEEIAAGRCPAPRRTLVFAYFADEEMGGTLGARWIAEHRPDLLDGVTAAIGEVGAFAVPLPDGRRLYPIQCAEKGMLWIRITVAGEGGHAAFSDGTNALVRAAEMVLAIDRLRPQEAPPATHRELVTAVGELFGPGPGPDELSADALGALGAFGALASLGDRTRSTPTIVRAGVKENVIPARAELFVDTRYLPGSLDATMSRLLDLLGEDDDHEIVSVSPGVAGGYDPALYERCAAALRRADPGAIVVPFVNSAGTDAQHFEALGVSSLGFMPVPLTPPGFDYLACFHTVDERVPMDAIARGAEILRDVVCGY